MSIDDIETIAAKVAEKLLSRQGPVCPEYLTEEQAARLAGFTVKGFEGWRNRGEAPPHFRIGRTIRYKASDVRAWVEAGGAIKGAK